MALGVFPHPVDTMGKLSSSVAPSGPNSLVNKTYADSVGGASLTTATANVTLNDIHTAYQAASAVPWLISPTGLSLSVGDILVGCEWVLSNTLYTFDSSFQSAPGSAFYDKIHVVVDNPGNSAKNPVFLSGASMDQSSWNEGSPYAPSPGGGLYPGFYRQDASFNTVPIVNYGATTTPKNYVTFPSFYEAAGTTAIRVAFWKATGTSTLVWTINDGTTYPTQDSTVVGTLKIYYRAA
jgi:hypothetical protein